MASGAFNAFNQGRPQQNGGGFNLQNLMNFKKSLNGRSPEEIVREKLQNGQMTQEQFNALAQQANQLYGTIFGNN